MLFRSRAGGTLFGTLPLLSTFLDKPIVEPSPYAPATRLFWNELYLDLHAIPEFRNSPGAQSLISRADWRAARDGLAALPLADQAAVWSLRLPLIDSICAAFPNEGERRAELEDFIRRRPKVREYAAFRARMDREGTTWPTWAPGSLNQDWDDPLFKRYILCQFWADGQKIRGVIHVQYSEGNPDSTVIRNKVEEKLKEHGIENIVIQLEIS